VAGSFRVIPARERPQRPGPGTLWADTWHIEFAGPDGVGGFVRLSLYPNLGAGGGGDGGRGGVAWWWTYLLRPDGPLVAVRDHEVPLPRGSGLEVRADGLWAELVCETPLEHWSIGLEAFGVAFDDPAEAWRSEWGDRTAVGLDLEWEALDPPVAAPGPGPAAQGYVQGGRVVGTLLVDEERIEVDCPGLRARSWGVSDWWAVRDTPAGAGASGGGVMAHWAASLGLKGQCRILDDSAELIEVSADPAGLPERAVYRLDGERWEATVLGAAPVLVTGPDGAIRLARGLCRFTGPGHEGFGWAEWRLGR
jgi:hypothetical protein